MEACTDEQRAEIEAVLREHNAEAVSEEEYLRSLQEAALQEVQHKKEFEEKVREIHMYYHPKVVATPRIDLNPQPFYSKFLKKRNKRK